MRPNEGQSPSITFKRRVQERDEHVLGNLRSNVRARARQHAQMLRSGRSFRRQAGQAKPSNGGLRGPGSHRGGAG